MVILKEYLSELKKIDENIYQAINHDGYWSNLSADENVELDNLTEELGCRLAIEKLQPQLSDIIFSEKRMAGLELLQLNGSEVAIDLGCMWGALSIPLAKQIAKVVGVDQTLQSLKFTAKRAKEDGLDNIELINANLRDFTLPSNTFDLAIVNGVLEWVPETIEVVVDEYLETKQEAPKAKCPRLVQLEFLQNIRNGLNDQGKLYLAIENRYDYKMFFGEKDPHSGLLFTSILPKQIANVISNIFRRRDYRTWIYSFSETKSLLEEAGFKEFQVYACWPDYRMPDHITPYKQKSSYYRPINPRKKGKLKFKRLVANRIEWFLFYKLNLQFFAPSIIMIAK